MNVQDFCEEYAERYSAVVSYLTGDEPPESFGSSFEGIDSEDWLKEANERITDVTSNPNANLADIIGAQESVAFLAAFQKAKTRSAGTRAQRWATATDSLKQAAEETFAVQFSGIGVKVDEEYITRLQQ